jgi:hypothetical protein
VRYLDHLVHVTALAYLLSGLLVGIVVVPIARAAQMHLPRRLVMLLVSWGAAALVGMAFVVHAATAAVAPGALVPLTVASCSNSSICAGALGTPVWSSGVTIGANAVTVTTDGVYSVSGDVNYPGTSSAGRRECMVVKNGGIVTEIRLINAASGPTVVPCMTTPLSLVAGDTVAIDVKQDSGSTMSGISGSLGLVMSQPIDDDSGLGGGDGGGCSTLACLSDVGVSSPAHGQVLTFDTASSTWRNADTCGTTDAGMSPCAVDIQDGGNAAGFLNNLHDDLFVLVGAVLGAPLILLITRWFTGGRD